MNKPSTYWRYQHKMSFPAHMWLPLHRETPQILPKKNGKTCVSRCVSQKTRMVGQENIDPPDFWHTWKVTIRKRKGSSLPTPLFSVTKLALKKLQRCMDLDTFFIGFFLFGFFPCFWAPRFFCLGKNQGETHRLRRFFFRRGATVSQHLRRLWSLQLCGRSDVPSVKVRGGTLGRLFSVVATQIFLIFTPKLGEMIHFD